MYVVIKQINKSFSELFVADRIETLWLEQVIFLGLFEDLN